jgi:uridine kinase
MSRQSALDQLAEHISRRHVSHPLRVAIDGIDAAGKTTLADELAQLLQAGGRYVIRASVDGFHRPCADRYRRGADSPEGYYYDSFDYVALRDALLDPLGPNGSRRYRCAVFDHTRDMPCITDEEAAPNDAILLFDGVFLLRPELNALWDYRIFVDVPFAVALRRAMARDLTAFGTMGAVETRYQRRYMPGQRLYLTAAHPVEIAHVVVDNTNPDEPVLVCRSSTRRAC